MRFTFSLVLAAWMAAIGCGSSVEPGGGGGHGGAGGGTGGGGGGSPCPATQPSTGDLPCTDVAPGFRCTYGDAVRPECRSLWDCAEGEWAPAQTTCQTPPPGACPAAEPAQGAACSSEGAACTYDNDLCVCSSCAGGPCTTVATWSCARPPTAPGCPAAVPNDGTACDAPGADCTYGFPCGPSGVRVTCRDGLWVWNTTVTCPT